MSRPKGAPGEFVCMKDTHWVTLSRLLKKNSPGCGLHIRSGLLRASLVV